MRASVAAEKEGIRSVSIVTTGFLRQARATAQALGLSNLAIAEYRGVPMTDSHLSLQDKVVESMVDDVVKGLTTSSETMAPVKTEDRDKPSPRAIIFKGTLGDVQEYFHSNLWTDGLPVIPPTIENVEGFLKFTDRSPDEIIGVLPLEQREATIWNIAVNGVMAGCRPEYMPVLIAAVEAIADPGFNLENAGSTPGWEPLVILNGPIMKELDFNYESGVMRVGRQANTSIGRFLRLYLRNVAGFRIPPGATDKGCIAGTFNVVLAENEDAAIELGWEPFSVDRGFSRGENVVTVQSCVSISPPTYSGGDKPVDHVETIAEVIGRQTMGYWTPIAGVHNGMAYPLIVLSPSVAGVIARGGWTKNDVRQYLYDNTRVRAGLVEKLAWQVGISTFSFQSYVERGIVPGHYSESSDPDRMVPVFLKPEWIGIVVSGDPCRNQSKGYVQNQKMGWPTSKRIRKPANWNELLRKKKR